MYNDHDISSSSRQRGGIPEADQPIARRKLSDEVLDRLLARIRSGEFPVGSWLPPERELMQSFGVGRPAVREAMQALQRMGLVHIVHGEGARVLPLSADTLIAQISDTAMHMLTGSSDLVEHLKEARLMFEVAMARLAAERATDADLARLREAIEAHKASVDDPAAFLETDMAFHRAIVAVSGNPIYMAVSQAILQWLQNFHHEAVRAPGVERTTLAEHVRMFECIAARDADGAAAAVVAHLTRAHQHYGTQATPARRAPSRRRPA